MRSEGGSLSNRLKSHRERVLMRAKLRHDEKAFSNVEEVALKVSIVLKTLRTPSSATEPKPCHPYTEDYHSQDTVKMKSRYAL